MLYQRIKLWRAGVRFRRDRLVPTPALLGLWRSIVFRYLAWRTARASGALWRWVGSGWRPPVLLLVGVGLIWAIAATWHKSGRLIGARSAIPWGDLLTVSTFLYVLFVSVLIGVGYQAYQARRRLIVLPFSNYAGDDCKRFVAGLPERLVSELRRLNDSYRTIDEMNPTGTVSASAPINFTVTVEDVGDKLRGAFSADSKFKLGPIEIPVRPLVTLFAGFVRGPRLSGSVHRSGDQFTLIAGIEDDNSSSTWCARATVAPSSAPGAQERALEGAVEDLLYRVFTDVVSVGSRKWEAVRLYSRGLDLFRAGLASGRDPTAQLSQAERLFIQALTQDKSFARCYYNLGVVYDKLENPDSARAAFESALSADNSLFDPAYALAVWHYARNNFDGARTFALRAIALRPSDARPWQVWGLAQKELQAKKIGRALQIRTDTAHWFDIIEIRETAAALAWRNLCRGVGRGENLKTARDTVAQCFNDAAVAWIMAGWPRRGRVILRQSLTQNRSASHYFEIGKSWHEWENLREAAENYRRALLIEDNPQYWSHLANVAAKRYFDDKSPDARAAVVAADEQIMICPSQAIGDIGKLLALAWRGVSEADRALGHAEDADRAADMAMRIETVPVVLQRAQPAPGEGEDARIARLEHWLAELTKELKDDPTAPDKPAWTWSFAMVERELADAIVERDGKRADDLLRDAKDKLAPRYAAEIVKQRLHAGLSRTAILRGDLGTALVEARTAVALRPDDPNERSLLGEVYWRLNDYERAQEQFEISIEFAPLNRNARDWLAYNYGKRGLAVRDRVRRREAYLGVIKSHGEILTILTARGNAKEALDFETQGRLHYWIGMAHLLLLEWNRAAYHLKIALEMKFKPFEGRMYLGWIHFEQQAYNEAESELRALATEARRALSQLRRAARDSADNAKAIEATALLRTRAAAATGEDQPINELLISAELLLARTYSERGDGHVRAERLVRLAKQRLKHTGPDNRRELEARCYDCQGWIDRGAGRLDKALRNLQASIRIWDDADAYYHLVMTCLDLAESSRTGRAKTIARAKSYLKQMMALDLGGQYAQRATEIEERLAALGADRASQFRVKGSGAMKAAASEPSTRARAGRSAPP